MSVTIDENAAAWEQLADRRSADLITSASTAAHAGLSLGVAEYTASEFGELQRHPDQEAVYCVSGRGLSVWAMMSMRSCPDVPSTSGATSPMPRGEPGRSRSRLSTCTRLIDRRRSRRLATQSLGEPTQAAAA